MTKILAAMKKNNLALAKSVEKDGDDIWAARLRAEAEGLQTAIWLISDYNDSFKSYGKIYFPEEFPNK